MESSSPNFSVLSEEWVSQPRSSSPSLPHWTPQGSRKSLPGTSPSRIPRFNSKSSRNAIRPSTSMKPIDPLSPRTDNAINIPFQALRTSRDPKSHQHPRTSTLTQTSSADSVVKHGSLNKPKPVAAGLNSDAHTPEWKRRLLNINQNAGADLFGPIGLEGIFTEPASDPDLSIPHQSLFSVGQGSDYMPSSPPPWPNSESNSNLITKSTSLKSSRAQLDILKEEDEDAEDTSAFSQYSPPDGKANRVAHEDLRSHAKASPDPSEGDVSDFLKGTKPAQRAMSGEPVLTQNHDVDTLNASNSAPATSKFSASSSSPPMKTDPQNHQSSSSAANGFSPVFISKHNTVDGRVDYAAVDLSDPQIISQLRHRAASKALNSHPIENAGEQNLPSVSRHASGTSSNTENLRSIDEHVTCERGDQLDPTNGSFRRKPLSPSASSSMLPSETLAPSDSVSQTCQNADGQIVHVRDLCPDELQDVNQAQNTDKVDDARNKVEQLISKYKSEQLIMVQDDMTCTGVCSAVHDEAPHIDIMELGQHHSRDAAQVTGETTRGPNETELSVDEQDPNRYRHHNENDVALLGSEVASQANHSYESSCKSHITAIQDPPPTQQCNDPKKAPLGDLAMTPTPADTSDHPHPDIQTLAQQDDLTSQPSESSTSAQSRNPLKNIIGKKRKDARYDNTHNEVDPSTLARREILRPRNPTPGQSLYDGSATTSTHDYSRFSEVPWNHSLESPHVLELSSYDTTAKARVLASEAATLRTETQVNAPVGTRKNSVSTQDYVDEAMKIMELIRRKKSSGTWMGVPSAGSHVGETQLNTTEPTPPPSPPRLDGGTPRNAWRGRDDNPPNPRVLSHLKKYEETGDESFLVSSIARSVKDADRFATQHQQGNVRITESLNQSQGRRHSDSEIEIVHRDLESPTKGHSSSGSTGSTVHTIRTDSSQRARNVPVISPDRVPHLLSTEQAGMRYDTAKHTWVRCKERQLPIKQNGALGSSSTGTDEDPLGQIPDLSVSGIHDENRSCVSGGMMEQSAGDPEIHRTSGTEWSSANVDQLPSISGLPERPNSAPERTKSAWSSVVQKSLQKNIYPENQKDLDSSDITEELHTPRYNGYPDDDLPSQSADVEPPPELGGFRKRPISHNPIDTVKSKRRDQAVMFSSPPVSREYDSAIWEHSDTTEEDLNPTENGSSPNDRRDNDPTLIHRRPSCVSGFESTRSGSVLRFPEHAIPFDQSISLPRADEHQEISFTQTRPDGRTMSLSWSVSTPYPQQSDAQSNPHGSAMLRSGQRTNNFFPHLSPLSEFTINQDDERHVRSHHLDKPTKVKFLPNHQGACVESAAATRELVTKLTDADLDEPDWEKTRMLSLGDKHIDSVHMLDELCPNLEQLDASGNNLKHVIGIPSNVRELDVSENSLSSFTQWSHLSDLQYLNASNNDIESLDGLRSLKHLREIQADDNNLTRLDGVLQMDGLLNLSLKNNKMTEVSFEDARLTRLTSLDLSDNGLKQFRGLHFLPSLERLNVSGNNLKHFFMDKASYTHHKLKSLRLDRNALKRINVAAFPNLEELFVNDNRMDGVSCLKYHKHLKTVEIRDQRLEPGQFVDLNDFRNMTHVYLSGTSVIPTLFAPNAREVPFYNLQTLDVSFTGLQSLPEKMGMLMPNMRTLNLNANSLKDLRPLKGMVGLRRLFAAGNRISRLRKLAKVLSSLSGLCGGVLEELDLRDCPVACGFYPAARSGNRKGKGEEGSGSGAEGLEHLLPAGDERRDGIYEGRLDEDTKMRRRVYELLLATRCKSLRTVDGLEFDRDGITGKRDGTWVRLKEMGVLAEKF